MPINKNIKINCKMYDCYWNIGKYKNNCASKQINLNDKECLTFISKRETQNRIESNLEVKE